MRLEKFDYNSFDELLANTYVVSDESKAVIIDPSKDYDGVNNYLNKNGLSPVAILLTHAHFDHFGGVKKILEKYPDVPIYLNCEDEELLIDEYKNCSFFSDKKVSLNNKTTNVTDGQIFTLFEKDEIKVIHTPFHTMGSVCYYFKNNKWLFSGDTLFKESIGRSDLPTSNRHLISSSLEKLKALDDDVKVYPGHGQNSSIAHERAFNLFMK